MSALQKGILDSKKQSPVSLNRDTTSFKLYTRKKWMWFNRAENCIVASWKATFWIFQAISFFLRIIVTTTKIQLMFNLSHMNNFSLPTLRTRSMLCRPIFYIHAGEKFSGRFVVAISVCFSQFFIILPSLYMLCECPQCLPTRF